MANSGGAPQLDESRLERAIACIERAQIRTSRSVRTSDLDEAVRHIRASLASSPGAGELDLTDEAKLRIIHDKLIEKARIKSKLRPGDEWDFWLEARGILDALRARLDRKDSNAQTR